MTTLAVSPHESWLSPVPTATLVPSPSWIEAIEQSCSLRGDRRAVRAFLFSHPTVLPIVVDSFRWIESAFGFGTPLALDVVVEPTDQSAELFVLIEWAGDPDEAQKRLAHLDEVWWLDVSGDVAGTLNLDVEYV